MHPASNISYDRTTRDYLVTFDGDTLGHVPTYLDGETAINEYIADLIHDGLMPTVAETEQDRDAVATETIILCLYCGRPMQPRAELLPHGRIGRKLVCTCGHTTTPTAPTAMRRIVLQDGGWTAYAGRRVLGTFPSQARALAALRGA
jgi:hypothetical protein